MGGEAGAIPDSSASKTGLLLTMPCGASGLSTLLKSPDSEGLLSFWG